MNTTGPVVRDLTTGQAAALLGVDTRTLIRWTEAGELSASATVGGHRRYARVDVDALLCRLASDRGPA